MKDISLDSHYRLFETKEILECKISKRLSVSEFEEILKIIKHEASKKNISKLLIDAYDVNFSDLSITERHDIGVITADILKSDFRAVCIAKERYINKVGETVANSRGAIVLVTNSFVEAFIFFDR